MDKTCHHHWCATQNSDKKLFIVEYSRCEHPVKAIKMIDANKLQCLCLVFTIEWFIFSWYTVTGIKRHSLSENKIDDDIYACTMYTAHCTQI